MIYTLALPDAQSTSAFPMSVNIVPSFEPFTIDCGELIDITVLEVISQLFSVILRL